jgi:2-polyprenyl-3-methyl-5-hydroxy-6-metoxy-1,4-benzoquinol methylase
MLISDQYRKLNSELHLSQAGYGSNGWQWIGPILKLMQRTKSKTVLDYGAGKGSLQEWMTAPVTCYDPVTFPDEPLPQDFVACLDVMEHIEPDCLDDVLRHISGKTLKAGLFVISIREAKKLLADGRNAHLIVQDKEFWVPRLRTFFRKVEHVKGVGRSDELVLYVEA